MVTVPRELIELLSRAAGNRSAGQPLFSQDGKLEEALQIVDREKAELQTAWHASRRKIRDLEAETSTAEDLEDGSVRITVPNLADRMEGLRKGFSSSVRNILGNNRGEVFLSMKQADQLFTPPEGDRTYTVSPEPVGDGSWRFRMTLESANGRRVWVGGNIPDEILHLTAAAHIIPRLDEDTGEDSEDE